MLTMKVNNIGPNPQKDIRLRNDDRIFIFGIYNVQDQN